MQRYTDFKVIGTNPSNGQVDVVWYDDTRGADGRLATPIDQQNILFLSHRVPVEAEENSWTREQMRQWWLADVDDVADIPQWAEDEVGKFSIDGRPRVRINRGT